MTSINKVLGVVMLCAAPSLVLAAGYSVGVGGELTRGDYGTGKQVTLVSLPFNVQYVEPRYAWGVTVPYVIVSGPSDVVVTGSGMGRGRNTTGSSTRSDQRVDSGIGDVSLSGTLRLWDESMHRPWVAMTARAKLGTADETRGLGTGENDYSLQLELAKAAFYGHVGYKWLGDPAGIDYDNIGYGLLGVGFPVGESNGGVELYGEQAAVDGADGKREVSAYLGQSLDATTRLNVYLLKGMSDASPDWGAGVALRFAL